ncbi:MAG: GatB/YqeY domain-containing protein [Kineosporiaceae bacterium]
MSAPTALREQLQSDLTTAIRSRDEVATATLRMVLTAVKGEEVSGDAAHDLTEEQVLAVLRREAKKRKEAATAFDGAGRPELAERERAELAVVESYLPAALGAEEVSALVAEEVAAAAADGAAGMKAMGRVIKAVQARAEGRADGAALAAEVKRQLSGS